MSYLSILDLGIYVSLGLFAGLLAGLIGLGGGVVLVPALAVIFAYQLPAFAIMKTALATSLASIIFTSAWAAWKQYRAGMIDLQKVKILAPSSAAGSLLGGLTAPYVPGDSLKAIFCIFALYVGSQMLSSGNLRFNLRFTTRSGVLAGGFSGAASSWVGIGGGSFIIPYLNSVREPHEKIVGTTSAVSVVLAIFATVGYALGAYAQHADLPNQIGYINLPALAGIVSGSAFGVPIGLYLAKRTSAIAIKRIFAIILLVECVRLALSLTGSTFTRQAGLMLAELAALYFAIGIVFSVTQSALAAKFAGAQTLSRTWRRDLLIAATKWALAWPIYGLRLLAKPAGRNDRPDAQETKS